MDKFTEALDALKTTAGKAMDLCQSLQIQNKAQADRIAELEKVLQGAQKALRKALPYMADSDDSHYVGEWLDEVNTTLKG